MAFQHILPKRSPDPTARRRWGLLFSAFVFLLTLQGCAGGAALRPCLQQGKWRASAAEDSTGLQTTDPAALLQEAEGLRWMGDYLRTVEHLDAAEAILARGVPGNILERDRLLVELGQQRAWLHYDRGEWKEGLRVARSALELDPGNASLLLVYGLLAGREGKRSQALEVADDLQRAEPHNPDGNWVRGVYRISRRQLREAFNLIEDLSPNRGHQAECWRDMGEIAESLEEYSRANHWYAESAHALPYSDTGCLNRVKGPRLKPGSRKSRQEVWLAFGRYYATGSLSAYTKLAFDRFDAAAADPGRVFWAEQTVNAAGILLRKGIDEPWAYRARGLVFAEMDQGDRALRDLRNASRLLDRLKQGDERIEATLGHLFLKEKDAVQALPHLRAAVRMNPKSAAAWRDLGLALILEGQSREAEQALDRSLALDPKSATSWYNRGLMFLHARDYGRAVADLKEAARLAPENREVIKLLQQAQVLERREPKP